MTNEQWIARTSFGEGVKRMSYSKLVEVFGEDRAKLVAAKFSIKKAVKPKRKKEEDGGE